MIPSVLHILRTYQLTFSSVLFVLMLFFSFFPSEPQQHIGDRSFSRMLWPSSSVSREVSSISRDDTHIFPSSPFMTETCAYTALPGRYSYVNRHICWSTHVHRHIYIPSPLLTSHYCPSYAQIVRIWMTQHGWYAASQDSGIATLPGSLSA